MRSRCSSGSRDRDGRCRAYHRGRRVARQPRSIPLPALCPAARYGPLLLGLLTRATALAHADLLLTTGLPAVVPSDTVTAPLATPRTASYAVAPRKRHDASSTLYGLTAESRSDTGRGRIETRSSHTQVTNLDHDKSACNRPDWRPAHSPRGARGAIIVLSRVYRAVSTCRFSACLYCTCSL